MTLTSFDRDGLVFDVTDTAGEGSPGPEGQGVGTVVLLHGFPADRDCWTEVCRPLTAAGLRTLAPEQRGYSPGARPAGRAAYRIEELVADVVALVDAAGVDRVHLVGHDWGGAVAWAVAGTHPDRLASLTVLSTPHPAALARAYRTWWQARHSAYMAWFQLPWLPEATFARTFPAGLRRSGLPEAVLQRYLRRMEEPGRLTASLGWYRAMGSSAGTMHRCKVPTTFVWGRHDAFLGRVAAEATGDLVRADYRFVELDEGHWLPEVAPGRCAEEILARVRSTTSS